MVVDFILLNLMASVGTLGLAAFLAIGIHPLAGIALMVAGFAFANWAWWDVYFGMDMRDRQRQNG